MMSKILAVGCLFFAAAHGEVSDAEAMVQTSVESRVMLESQVATLKMMLNGMSMLRRSHPAKKHKHPQGHLELNKQTGPPRGCSKDDFDAVVNHIQGLVDEYKPKFEQAQKENDTEAIGEYIEDLLPAHCDLKQVVKGMSVDWNKMEACMVEFTNVSNPCAQCPIHFMQSVCGKSALEVPFSCAMKCAPAAAASVKCGDAEDGCDDNMLEKLAPCLSCLNPKIIELGKCTAVPHYDNMVMKLNAVHQAVKDEDTSALNDLANKTASEGREELEWIAKSGSALNKVLGLIFSAVMD